MKDLTKCAHDVIYREPAHVTVLGATDLRCSNVSCKLVSCVQGGEDADRCPGAHDGGTTDCRDSVAGSHLRGPQNSILKTHIFEIPDENKGYFWLPVQANTGVVLSNLS